MLAAALVDVPFCPACFLIGIGGNGFFKVVDTA